MTARNAALAGRRALVTDAARQIANALGRGNRELRIGQGKALYFMACLAPRFIFGKLNDTPIGPPSGGKGAQADANAR